MREKHCCRCCLSEECCKNMCNEYLNGERKEIYAEMLLNTFNIKISNPERNACLICEKCITKLRAAAAFKEQVLTAQEAIVGRFNTSTNDLQLKIEVDEDMDDFDDKVSDNYSESNFMWNDEQQSEKGQVFVIKLEPKLAQRISNGCSKNAPSVSRVECNKISLKSSEVPKVKQSRPNKNDKITKRTRTIKATARQGDAKYVSPPLTQNEKDARENTLKLIQNSNLCLFRSLKTKFGCFSCQASFVESFNLREHSLTHTNNKLIAHRVSKWRGLSYKNADISDLKCNICSEELTSITDLMEHLKEQHEISFRGTNNFLIPYKLVEENRCFLCQLKFNTFLRLSIHMNTHYTNNVCEICGFSFINRLSLRMHVQSMHREKKCSHCPAKFLKVSSKVAHLKKVHNVYNSKRYCNLCEKTFAYSYMLVKHKIEEHGAKKTIVNCSHCGKTFFHEANLKVHVRSVHIKERNYPCEVCGTRFFTKCDQKRHEKTHDDLRSFSCSNCDAKFKSKDSWRRHMKRQHGHLFT